MPGKIAENENTEMTEKQTSSARRKAHAAQARRKRRKLLFVILSLFLTFYIAISLLLGLGVYYSFNSTSKSVRYGVRTVKYVGEKKRESVIASANADTSNRGYGLYISAEQLDGLCGFSFAGDKQKLTVILPESGDYMECYAGSSLVVINGTRFRLAQPVLYESDTYYLPVLLAEEYISGLKIEYSEKDKLCRISLENGEDTVLHFRFQQTPSPRNIPVPSLS